MKKCIKCNLEKVEDCFAFRKDTNKYRNVCFDCGKENKKSYYIANKQKIIKTSRKNSDKTRKELRIMLNGLKNKPCKDCGKSYPPCAMDFDHTENNKVKKINIFLTNCNKAKLIEEVNKCEIVCSNCHRIRTHNRNQYIKKEN